MIDIIPFDKGQYDTTCNQYILETDDGLVSTIMGSGTDKQLEGVKLKGSVVLIMFKGKLELPNGKMCNKFKVQIIESA